LECGACRGNVGKAGTAWAAAEKLRAALSRAWIGQNLARPTAHAGHGGLPGSPMVWTDRKGAVDHRRSPWSRALQNGAANHRNRHAYHRPANLGLFAGARRDAGSQRSTELTSHRKQEQRTHSIDASACDRALSPGRACKWVALSAEADELTRRRSSRACNCVCSGLMQTG